MIDFWEGRYYESDGELRVPMREQPKKFYKARVILTVKREAA
jgi:hypothetical protein